MKISPTLTAGTHIEALRVGLASLPADSLVIEHGAGLYSSPAIARTDARVLCIESVAGWAGWAQWLYGDRCLIREHAKRCIADLPGAALVFIDGKMGERADLLEWSLAAGVPLVIAHDTQDGRYDYDLNARDGYVIEHDTQYPRTTVWRKQ